MKARKKKLTSISSGYYGFSLIELMIVLAILGVLVGASFIAVKNYIPNEDVRQVALQLQSAFLMARSEAVKRSNNVYITASEDGYSGGWIVSTNLVRTYEQCVENGDADCVYVFQNERNISFSGDIAQVFYDRQGRLPLGLSLSVSVCDINKSSFVTKRVIDVASNGFPKISNDGKCSL